MENKTTIQMTIRKGEQTETVRLPCDFLTIKVALYQIDVLKEPDEVTVQDVNATFQSDDALGQKLTAMIQPTDLLSDVDVAVYLLRAAPKPVREALSKMVLEDGVENIRDIVTQRDALVEQLGQCQQSYYFPLTCTFEDEESDYTPVEGYPEDLLRNADKIQKALQKDQSDLMDTMAIYFWTSNPETTASIQEKLVACVWDVEEREGRLYGKVEVTSTVPLDAIEGQAMKDWICGQNSDGLGEGFEQRPIETEWGDLYVHLWHSGNDYEIVTAEEMGVGQRFGMEMG